MEGGQGKLIEIAPPKKHTCWMASQISLRIMAAAATFVAAWIALTNNQTVLVFGIQFQARYNYTSAFKFLVIANFITCASTVLSSFLPFVLGPFNYFYLFLHDLVVTTLLMAGCAAASAEGYLGKHGNIHSGWLPVCDHVTKFCNRMTVSVTLSYLAFALYLSLTVISAHKSRHIQQV